MNFGLWPIVTKSLIISSEGLPDAREIAEQGQRHKEGRQQQERKISKAHVGCLIPELFKAIRQRKQCIRNYIDEQQRADDVPCKQHPVIQFSCLKREVPDQWGGDARKNIEVPPLERHGLGNRFVKEEEQETDLNRHADHMINGKVCEVKPVDKRPAAGRYEHQHDADHRWYYQDREPRGQRFNVTIKS